jgi:hypothetical protein
MGENVALNVVNAEIRVEIIPKVGLSKSQYSALMYAVSE